MDVLSVLSRPEGIFKSRGSSTDSMALIHQPEKIKPSYTYFIYWTFYFFITTLHSGTNTDSCDFAAYFVEGNTLSLPHTYADTLPHTCSSTFTSATVSHLHFFLPDKSRTHTSSSAHQQPHCSQNMQNTLQRYIDRSSLLSFILFLPSRFLSVMQRKSWWRLGLWLHISCMCVCTRGSNSLKPWGEIRNAPYLKFLLKIIFSVGGMHFK